MRSAGKSAETSLVPRREGLRVLIANELDDRLDRVSAVIERLGHDIVARSLDPQQVGALSRQERADVAVVGVGLEDAHSLELIDEIVHEAACPVIALLDARDPAYVEEAARRGIFAYVLFERETEDLQGAIDITMRRFAELRDLRGAFGRRAVIEQAKGILMARNGVDADAAFAVMRAHSRRTGQKLIDVAEAVTKHHMLLSPDAAGAEREAAG